MQTMKCVLLVACLAVVLGQTPPKAPAPAPKASVVISAQVPAKAPTPTTPPGAPKAAPPSTPKAAPAPAPKPAGSNSCIIFKGKNEESSTKTIDQCALTCLSDKSCTAISFNGDKVDVEEIPFWEKLLDYTAGKAAGLCVQLDVKDQLDGASLKTCEQCRTECNSKGEKNCGGFIHDGLDFNFGAKNCNQTRGPAPAPSKARPPAKAPVVAPTKAPVVAPTKAPVPAPAKAPSVPAPAPKTPPAPAPKGAPTPSVTAQNRQR